MASTTLNLPGTAANVAGGLGGPAWTNVNNAKTVGAGTADCTFNNPDESSDLLVVTNFGFTITAGSTIDGIIVSLVGFDDFIFDGDPYATGVTAQLYYNGALMGGSGRGSLNPTRSILLDNTLQSAGSATDQWGGDVTQAIATSSSFGVALFSTSGNFDTFPASMSIDYVKMQIFYSLPGGNIATASSLGKLAWWQKR